MKYIIFLIFIIAFVSCKKESTKVCWTCTLNTTGGPACPGGNVKTVCNDGEEPAAIQDCNGNEPGQVCVRN